MHLSLLFEKGVSFMEFIRQDKDMYQEKTLEIYHAIEIDEELKKEIQRIHVPIHVLVFAEIWCPDCMINVPILQKMADLNSHFKIGILPKEGNEKHMERLNPSSKPKIPTFVFLDKDFQPIGVFIEQPKALEEINRRGKKAEILVAKRKYRKGEFSRETIREILDIIQAYIG